MIFHPRQKKISVNVPLVMKNTIIKQVVETKFFRYLPFAKAHSVAFIKSSLSAPLFTKLKVTDIYSINSFSVAKFMYSYHHNLLPSSFCNLFLSSNQVHHYETRLASQYRPRFCRTNIKQFSIHYRLQNSPYCCVFKYARTANKS